MNPQDKLSESNVFAQHQKTYGMLLPKHAHAQLMPTEITVSHVHFLDNGTSKTTHVSVLHQQLNGMVKTVHVQLVDMVHLALNAQLQDIGILLPTNVSVIHHLSSTEKTAFALNRISFSKEDVEYVQQVQHGK